ncbi:MAG TPA: S41 family peptidase [Allosphingosinicella sp.]|jgi:hypothetical protein
MSRTFRTLILALLAAASPAAAAPAPAPAFDRAAWKADFERIKAGLAQGYANLDWQVERRGLNLKRADAQIGAMLDKATRDAEAMLALTKLVDAFRDPHLAFQPGPPPPSARALPAMSALPGAAPACTDVDEPRAATRLPYAKSPKWRPLAGAPFPSGYVGTTGFIRIPSFDEARYAPACAGIAEDDPRARQLAYRAALNRMLLGRIAALKAKGVKRLVIDLSGNGGGSEWSSELAALLAAGTLERPAPRLVAPTCDRSGVWRGEKVCSPYGPASTERLAGQGKWTGPTLLLTDRNTASAAEEFVTWLRDNDRAKAVGERTFGAGCGYVDGGGAIALTAAPVHLMVPNCSRFTKAGLNEVEGLAPDVAVDWGLSSPEAALAAIDRGFRL